MSQPRLLNPVADELLELGLAPTSARSYSQAIRQLQRWCAENGSSLATITAAELVAFQAHHPRARSSRKLLRQALHHWWTLHPRPNPPLVAIRVPPRPRGRCRALEEDQAATLEAAARARHDREGTAVLVGLYLGLRRAEIAAMRWPDLADGWLRIIGKGDVVAELPIHPVLAAALDELPRHPSGWLFPGRHVGPVNPTTVWTWVRKVSAEAGVPAVCTHRLRHTALATANDVTHDLRAVQEFARHAKPETTAIYTRVTAKRLVEVAMAINYGSAAS
jgi:integrase